MASDTPDRPDGAHRGRPRRLGILGGTFDPIHVAHLVAAVNVRWAMDLDEVLLVVANVPWQKVGERRVSPAEDRFAVVVAAVEDVDGVEASRLELDRGGTSYTADTLAQLHREEPDAQLFLIVGADVAGKLNSWERIDEVQRQCTLVVVNRPGQTVPETLPGWKMDEVVIPNLEVSSTEIRRRAQTGEPLEYLVPVGAVREIRARGLYADG